MQKTSCQSVRATAATKKSNSARRAAIARSRSDRAIFCAALIAALSLHAEPVAVRLVEGLSRGFLTLETLEGKRLADGESSQTVRGDRVTSRLVLQFLDGSFYEDTAV